MGIWIGSLLSHRYPRVTRPATTLLLALVVALCAMLLPTLFIIAAPWPLPYPDKRDSSFFEVIFDPDTIK